MLANFHTHTSFCDGKNTPEEITEAAIQKGFSALGFSGHGYTDFDLRYCMKDTDGYLRELMRLKEEYKAKIQLYAGVEEDAFCPVDRTRFEYIIGSSHYLLLDGKYYPIDSGHEYFMRALEAFRGDTLRLAETYYGTFCAYIKRRRPDIIGHFDLITKFDELGEAYFLGRPAYSRIAERAVRDAAGSGCLFEVNTGAVARGLRTTVYPSEELLCALKKENAGLILSADAHRSDTLDFYFEETKRYLYDIGFRHLYVLYDGTFQRQAIL